jgi:hypothetical protein
MKTKKNFANIALLCSIAGAGLSSCNKQDLETPVQMNQAIEAKIHNLGFSTDSVRVTKGGYIVEGDIFLTAADLEAQPSFKVYKAGTGAQEEHYSTNNLITYTTRFNGGYYTLPNVWVIPVMVDPAVWNNTTEIWHSGVLDAINRYYDSVNPNGPTPYYTAWGTYAPGTPGTITITSGSLPQGVWASAGFPSNGNPFPYITINLPLLSTQQQVTVASILSHEMGHCIGFRHTDYMDRRYSCGGSYYNEGTSTEGANWIPGTEHEASPNSWMLSCINSGMNRPLTPTDKYAIRMLYKVN